MLLAKNRKGLRNYDILEKFVAGVALKGHEVKAIREGNVSFEGAYVKIVEDVPMLISTHIGKYSKQSQDIDMLDPKRDRILLLNKKEIEKIARELNQKGKSAVPIAFILRNNLVKLELAVVKGRKAFKVKQVEKDKQVKKDLEKFTAQARKGIWD